MLIVLAGSRAPAAASQLADARATLWFAVSQRPKPRPGITVIEEPRLTGIVAVAERLAHPAVPARDLVVPNLDCLRRNAPYERAPVLADFDADTAQVARQIVTRQYWPEIVVLASARAFVEQVSARIAAGAAAAADWGGATGRLIETIATDVVTRVAYDLARAATVGIFTCGWTRHAPDLPVATVDLAEVVARVAADGSIVVVTHPSHAAGEILAPWEIDRLIPHHG